MKIEYTPVIDSTTKVFPETESHTIYTNGAPVENGRWVHESLVSTSGGTYEVVRCSRCKSQFPLYETTYCPNCGARMDGDDNEID